MLYTAAPSTCPVGSKPTLRIAVNSSADRADPQVPLWRISAIRAAAAGGRPGRGASSVTAYLSRGHPTILGASTGTRATGRRHLWRPTHGYAPGPVPGHGWLL